MSVKEYQDSQGQEVEEAKAPKQVSETALGLNYSDRLKWASLDNRIIYLHASIDSSVVREKSMEMQDLLRRSKEPIYIMVSSPGGYVLPGLALHDEILELQKEGIEVTMRVCGYAASMAAIVLQAGTIREALANSRMLIHEISRFTFWAEEKPSDLKEQVAEMEKLQRSLMRIVSGRTDKTVEELENLIWKRDVWFSAEEALAFGLLDRIV